MEFDRLSKSSMHACLELFEDAFGTKMSGELWKWKYFNGRGDGVLCKREKGNLVAFYGGITRDLYIKGTVFKAIGISDTMVRKSERGAFLKRGVFFRCAKKFIDEKIANKKEYKFAYGFPSVRHSRLGVLLGLYSVVDEMYEVEWKFPKGKKGFFLNGAIILDKEDILKSINLLYKSMERSLEGFIFGVKSKKWISHRYLEHPEISYSFFKVYNRFTKKVLGVVVYKIRDNKSLEILDIIATKENYKRVVEYFLLFSQKRVYMWVSSSVLDYLPKWNNLEKVCDICVTNEGEYRLEEIEKCWFISGGESDFR